MSEVIVLPENLIGKEDRELLSSFAGHQIGLGRATRFHWGSDEHGDVLELYRGRPAERLLLEIRRDRERDLFLALDPGGRVLAEGKLDHVMVVLDTHLAELHHERRG